MENKQQFYGWKLVGALWFLYLLNMGFPLYGGAVINTYMLKEITMERSVYGMGFTLLNFFVGVPSILVAAAIGKWGIRSTFGIGSALILIGTLWMAFVASQPWHYLVGFGVIIGSGIGFGTIVPLSTAVTRWFKRYRGRAMAITLTASGFAGFLGAPLMNKVLAANGGDWRQAWLMVAGIAIVAAVVAFLTVKERPEDLGQLVDGIEEYAGAQGGPANSLATKFNWTPSEAYGTRAFWMIVVGSFACQFPFFFFTAHWILHLRGLGINPADAAWAMGLFTMGGIGGRLIGGWLMDKMPARFAFMMGICCYFVGSFLAINVTASSLMVAFAAAILYGAGFGWTFVCLNTMVGNFFGPVAFPKVNGTMLLLSALACSPAGMVGGKLFDMFKSYTPAFYLNVAICLVGIFALFFATMPQKKTADSTIKA
ncbi:MFS transporter [Sporomusa sp.]|uniref:MFS transporter n=1 Tax=Sporomusa sp. TaxID=2078658 RepID=UPI002C5A107E|nr:MFS transporter [Sporomusa sp.]HWR42313.1 MFS transporter [Sporomusa sp.]